MSARSHAPDCRCCAGVDAATPRRVDNAPGLPVIAYRAGRHGDFLESMAGRLSSADYPALAALTTREPSDPTLALADALASSLEVLTFYTERFANQHYLRTTDERLAVRELARLIGYRLAPGVAASTHLAFTLQAPPGAPSAPIEIPIGTRVQSVPGQGEQAQTFETVAVAPARAEWNAMPVQSAVPFAPSMGDTELWLDGLSTQLQPGDAILIVGTERMNDSGNEHWDVRVAASVELDRRNERTRVRWKDPLGSLSPFVTPASTGVEVHAFRQRTALFGHNAPNPNMFSDESAGILNLIDTSDASDWRWHNFALSASALDLDTDNAKIVAGSFIALVSNEAGIGSADLPGYVELYRVSRVVHRSRSDFGISGKVTTITPDTTENLTAARFDLRRTLVLAHSERLATTRTPLFHPVHGDALTLGVRAEGLIPGQPLALSGVRQRIALARGAKGLSLTLAGGGSVPLTGGDELFMIAPAVRLMGTVPVALDAETFASHLGNAAMKLTLTVMDRDGRTGTLAASGDEIELAASRKDDPRVSEVVLIAGASDAVVHGRDHTTLALAAATRHVYERASLRVNANVAPATHGESVTAILGDGDGRLANQRFALGQTPLTYVSASNPTGRASTLELRIDDVLWSEVPTLYGAKVDARVYETSENDAGLTSVQLGDGTTGARLPSGVSNVRVRYRKGLGAGGNVAAGKLTTLLSRPLGVSEAVNPEPATGGEDPETLERARENAPLTVLTLDRAVSISDYQSFARAFAGIDKAHALWIATGPARGVFLTVAGVAGAAVPESSATFVNLRDALRSYGDPLVPLRIASYAARSFRCRLSVKLLHGFELDKVLAAVEAALRAHFAFERRRFGQPVSVDEVAAVAQAVKGVEAVHVAKLYRAGDPELLIPRLFAKLPVASITALPEPAELLCLDAGPIALEVLP